MSTGQEWAICIRLPMPPGTLPTLWRDDQRYLSGDGGYLDEDGYLYVMGRTERRHQRGRAPALHWIDGGRHDSAPRPWRSALSSMPRTP